MGSLQWLGGSGKERGSCDRRIVACHMAVCREGSPQNGSNGSEREREREREKIHVHMYVYHSLRLLYGGKLEVFCRAQEIEREREVRKLREKKVGVSACLQSSRHRGGFVVFFRPQGTVLVVAPQAQETSAVSMQG